MTNKANLSLPSPTAPTWQNWSGNLVHQPAADGVKYYFAPSNLNELKAAIAEVAKLKGATIRSSGQRHSQPPLVVQDNRGAVPKTTNEYLVDLSCYADLGTNKDQRILSGPGENQVTINTGVREDELDDFLTKNKLMMKTVTAGGFFSLGGMTAVDVHGATMDEPIFAETVSAFNILLADGTIKTIDKKSPAVDGWSPLQFARVSLGGLGIVTSIVLDVMPRPLPSTLQGSLESLVIHNKKDFVKNFLPVLEKHDRVETFFTPYANMTIAKISNQPAFLALCWNVEKNPAPETSKQLSHTQDNACVLASKQPPEYGAPYLKGFAQFGADIAQKSQFNNSPILGGAAEITAVATFNVIKKEVTEANESHSELWLTGAVSVIFMSYYIQLPDLKGAGLGITWDGLDVVSKIVTKSGNFHIAAPMEFRFVKGGDTAMSGTYCEDPENTWFLNLDLIGFVEAGQKANEYSPELLQFFADVERAWVKMGGFPHNGKMYGFYDPTDSSGAYSKSGPFNPNFLADLRKRRGKRLEAYAKYRNSLDPNGLFKNKYLRELLG